jgi:hypothetical protein
MNRQHLLTISPFHFWISSQSRSKNAKWAASKWVCLHTTPQSRDRTSKYSPPFKTHTHTTYHMLAERLFSFLSSCIFRLRGTDVQEVNHPEIFTGRTNVKRKHARTGRMKREHSDREKSISTRLSCSFSTWSRRL